MSLPPDAQAGNWREEIRELAVLAGARYEPTNEVWIKTPDGQVVHFYTCQAKPHARCGGYGGSFEKPCPFTSADLSTFVRHMVGEHGWEAFPPGATAEEIEQESSRFWDRFFHGYDRSHPLHDLTAVSRRLKRQPAHQVFGDGAILSATNP